jgi:hypothetical protein
VTAAAVWAITGQLMAAIGSLAVILLGMGLMRRI